ncbi:MAG TPA: SPOR domain-containing protein [Verrucomicrobiae bacterium]|nr:SPOR domain-containing protein [Verrucomicrobiae bacterium]
MLKRLFPLATVLLAACAGNPPPPPLAEPAPPPAIITDEGTSTSDADSVEAPPPDAPAKPQQTDAGRFRIGVASMDSAEATRAWVTKLEAAGYRTEILPVEIDGKTWHRVLLPGYASLEEARAAVPFIEKEFGATGVWVTSRRRAPLPAAVAPAEPVPAEAPMPAVPEPTAPPAPTAPAESEPTPKS